jgi:Ser/Thr protein kinase RdoA (MazF antagonist)
MSLVDSDLTRQLASRYRLGDVELRHLGTPVNDVVAVNSAAGEFALKLYHRKRTPQAVQWEVDLVRHLFRRGAPVAQPIRGRDGYLEYLTLADHQHIVVLFAWASGCKPDTGYETYGLLGEAAARIHRAADGFAPSPARESYDAAALIDDQLHRMQPLLIQAARWRSAVALGERLKRRLAESSLDWGICHMDLSLDNVHLAENLTVFDFDSAGTSWRAVEPWGVLRSSARYFQAWLDGYRTARAFGKLDEAAVAVFGIVGDLRVVTWKLGVAESSRGAPRLGIADLPAIVDSWLAHLTA